MADNPPPIPPPSPNTGPLPKLPQTGLTGRLKNATQRLPIRTAGGGKIVVMLSSVAKPPPAGTQALPRVPTAAPAPTPSAPPLPPKQVVPAKELPTPSKPNLSATTYVKLPPKTAVPGWSSLSGKAVPLPATTPPMATPSPASSPVPPPKVAELTKKPGAQHIPPIKFNDSSPAPESRAEESIFLAKSTPAPAPTAETSSAISKTPMPVTTTAPMVRPDAIAQVVAKPLTPTAPPVSKGPADTKVPEGNPVTLDLFEKSQTPSAKSSPPPAPEAKDKPAPLIAPPLMPPNLATPPPASGGGLRPVRPPPLPPTLTKPLASALTPPPKIEKSDDITPPVAQTPPLISPPKLEKTPEPKAPGPVAAIIPPPLPKPAESPIVPGPMVHVAPPMLEKAPEPVVEKLPPPLTKPVEMPIGTSPEVLPKLERAPELKAFEPVAEKLSPPLAKPVEAPVVPGPLVHVAPPMLEKASEPLAEKLPPPHPSSHAPVVEARKADAPPGLPDSISKPVQKAPAMLPSETSAPKPSQPPKLRRSITSWLKKTTPIVVSSASTKAPPPPPAPVVEAKPALKPPTLPSRSLLVPTPVMEPAAGTPNTPDVPKVVEAPKPAPESKGPEKAPEKPVEKGAEKISEKPAPVTTPSVAAVEKPNPPTTIKPGVEAVIPPAAIAAALAADKKKSKDKPVSKIGAASKPPSLPPEPPKATVPLTRVERARKRRVYSLVFFWAFLFPLTIGVLFWASLQVARDTRLEGQVIPPPGTVLSNEVWIVTDFRSLASGITEDLAAERTPLMQEIQERQDHVRRAQADVASREERIRLIQEQIAARKSEIESVVKQARNATQKVWDVDGAAVDNEYASRMAALKRTIADRAKSLNLKYVPDDTYDSPEVWANAYRLALYEVPAGVDGVKEHTWLSDQMKQWRDYQKSADDQKEALREKAAQIKLGPAPKITELNAKIDELQQRIDATEAEEVPLKAELQQAQADLVTAQSADVGLDDKYYRQLYSLPGESVIKRIELKPNGRFTWLDDNVFLQGESQHSYYIFARATRADGRQYWSLGRITIEKNHVLPVVFEPANFLSTKAILRPTLSPEEVEQ